MRLNWEKLLSTRRVSEFGPCKVDASSISQYADPRSHYERDLDQIVFSYPFRRLQDKTQVIPFPKFDFVHTRLTHSIEVASIGRSFGKLAAKLILTELGEEKVNQLGICPSDIGALLAAACLAHDIGNPPFGHSGEDAISYYFKNANITPWTLNHTCDKSEDGQEWTFFLNENESETLSINEVVENTKKWNDLVNFEGNANGFRILTMNCDKGINPTAALLGTFSKYPRESYFISDPLLGVKKKKKPASQQKYGFFYEQRELFREIASELGLQRINHIDDNDISYFRHPLAFLMEAADDIAYRMIDFEDGIRLGLIDFTKKFKLYPTRDEQETEDELKKIEISAFDILRNIATIDKECNIAEVENKSEKEIIVYLRNFVINTLIHETFKIFEENYEQIMNCTFDVSLIESLKNDIIINNLFMMRCLIEKYVYNYAPVLENEAAGFDVLGRLIDDFVITTNICFSCEEEETEKQKKIKSLIPLEYQPTSEDIAKTVDFSERYKRILKILDFISGMTDSYAVNKFRRIHGIEIAN